MSAEKSVNPLDPAGHDGGVDLEWKNHLDEMGDQTTMQQIAKVSMTPAKAPKGPNDPMNNNTLMQY